MPQDTAHQVRYYLKTNNIQQGEWYFYTNQRITYEVDIRCTEEDLTVLLLAIPNIKYQRQIISK